VGGDIELLPLPPPQEDKNSEETTKHLVSHFISPIYPKTVLARQALQRTSPDLNKK
jgi:hypothetical protein